MKWINTSPGDDIFSAFVYIDESGDILGGIQIWHKTRKVKWYVGTSKGPGRSMAHAKKVVERSVR